MSDEPYAEITQVGRWLHSIEIHDGLSLVTREDWYAFGRRHAERKAARVLRRYLLAEQRRQSPIRVTIGDAGTCANQDATWLPMSTGGGNPRAETKDGDSE